MKVVIAAWHLKDFNVGLGRYAGGLIQALADLDPENHYEIITPPGGPPLPSRPNMRVRVIAFPPFKRRVWEQAVPAFTGRYDVLHLPYDSCVVWKRGKFISTIHDVKPLLYSTGRVTRSWFERLLVQDRRAWIDHVVTDSEHSRRDIVQHLGYGFEQISVVYPGVDLERFRPAVSESRQGACPSSYILCVGGPDRTKNIETLLVAYSHLPEHVRGRYDLVLAGDFRRRDDIRDLVARTGIQGQVKFSGIVTDDRLVKLYQHAAVFAFPSRYEGFGLPVLEAMACGCPVITSNASSLPEVAGESAILLSPDDDEGFTDALTRVLEDHDLADQLRDKGLTRAAQFSWSRTAQQMLSIYGKVVDG